MKDEYVNFGDIARNQMNQQCQYACRYFCNEWEGEYPYLGEGLRILGNSDDYHSMKIHKDDVDMAVKRYLDYRYE